MQYDKSPGQSGLSTDMIKNLLPRAFNYFVKLIQDFWRNPNTDFASWHITLLKVLYKGKGDPQDPNNSCGIAFNETSAKVLSIVLARRLLKRLREINPTSQFGHVGCQEAQHTIKRALLLRRQHGLESYAIFVDLVKAFDTVNHQLLCQILSKYGLPPLVEIVRKLYNNCTVKRKVRSRFTEIEYTTGVHQGDNMSSVLFLFVMQAFLETLQLQTPSIQFAHFPSNKNKNLKSQKGRLLSQSSKAKGSPFTFNSSFYVDDSFFLFQTRQQLQQAVTELHKHFARFGLIIIHFVNKFKYLSTIITPLLNEDTEIETRIAKAKSLMGAAKHFFDNKDVDNRIKSQIYVAGPLNALLWGCESWNLTKNNLHKLTAFHHGAFQRILRIKWSQVRKRQIKNREVRGLLCNIPDIDAFIHRRTATYIGKIIRANKSTYPKKFLAAWINDSKKPGAPQLTCNNRKRHPENSTSQL